jgi:hypothetical protein
VIETGHSQSKSYQNIADIACDTDSILTGQSFHEYLLGTTIADTKASEKWQLSQYPDSRQMAHSNV